MTYSETEDKPTFSMAVVPKDQLALTKKFVSLDSFKGSDKRTLTNEVIGGGACKLIVTTELKIY